MLMVEQIMTWSVVQFSMSVDYYHTKHNLYNVMLNLNNFHLF